MIFLSTLPARGATGSGQQRRETPRISIHAPREGSDPGGPITRHTGGHFYPRSPRGERHEVISGLVLPDVFLSTLPARGATGRPTLQSTRRPISIHAPREGSDQAMQIAIKLQEISIHAPREGSDSPAPVGQLEPGHISIHAPREGSDAPHLEGMPTKGNFYPRSPRGERLK